MKFFAPLFVILAVASQGSVEAQLRSNKLLGKKEGVVSFQKAFTRSHLAHGEGNQIHSPQDTSSSGEDHNALFTGGAAEPRIIGGDEVTSSNEYPYFVDLQGCGGSLIAPNVVLTAAHCEPSGFFLVQEEVRVGAYQAAWDEQDGSTIVRVAAQMNHPSYDDWTIENDFMLLLLEEDVVTANEARNGGIVQLSDDADVDMAPGTNLHVLGLGLTETDDTPDTLLDATVEAFSDADCLAAYGPLPDGINPENMFCAGIPAVGGKDTCSGDSGGPIVRRVGNTHIQVGVTSWGAGCADPDFPGVYSRIPSAIDWIKQVVCIEWDQASAPFCSGVTASPTSTATPTPQPTATTQVPLVTSCTGAREILVQFDFITDDYAHETSWEIFEASTGKIMISGGLYDQANHLYQKATCLSTKRGACYILTLHDSFGDGMTEIGSYELLVDGESKINSTTEGFKGNWINFSINC